MKNLLVQKWEKTGLLYNLDQVKKEKTAQLLEDMAVLVIKNQDESAMLFPVVRLLAESDFYPAATALYNDYNQWSKYNSHKFVGIDAEPDMVKSYVSVCKERLSK